MSESVSECVRDRECELVKVKEKKIVKKCVCVCVCV